MLKQHLCGLWIVIVSLLASAGCATPPPSSEVAADLRIGEDVRAYRLFDGEPRVIEVLDSEGFVMSELWQIGSEFRWMDENLTEATRLRIEADLAHIGTGSVGSTTSAVSSADTSWVSGCVGCHMEYSSHDQRISPQIEPYD
ncbi:MAG: hypothetical protein AAGF12_00345 [Myxococcota bacterium]